jgi:hypothetical protein
MFADWLVLRHCHKLRELPARRWSVVRLVLSIGHLLAPVAIFLLGFLSCYQAVGVETGWRGSGLPWVARAY